MSQLVDFLVENEPAFRKARLPALYSDFQSQRTINPDGYQANISAWRRALAAIARSGLAPSPRAATSDLLVLGCNEQLVRALESKQYGRPLALGAVVREALSEKDLMALPEFLAAKNSIYHRPWSLWSLGGWTMRQLGVADMLRSDSLPSGQFVVLANVEETAKAFGDKNAAAATAKSPFERTFSRAHFSKTFADELTPGKHLSDTDVEVLLRFLSRDKGVLLYDGKTVKLKTPGDVDQTAITDEDTSIAQLKELLEYLTHQTTLLSARVDDLGTAAKTAVARKNRPAALAALRSKKLAETTLAQRLETVGQLEAVAARLAAAADNVAVVRVMQASGEALRSLNAAVGGAEGVGEVADRLREQMEQADEVSAILAESQSSVVVDDAELDAELAAMEGEEKRKEQEAAREREAAERRRREEAEAGETRKRLETVEKPSAEEPFAEQAAEALGRLSLEEDPRPQPAS